MKLSAILPLLLTVPFASPFKLRGTGNYTLQQQQENETGVYPRIFNGFFAEHNQFRYQVGLEIFLIGGAGMGLCSGSLISREWVLTAAHCLLNTERVVAYLGNTELAPPSIVYHIDKHDLKPHRSYKKDTFRHDIGLIQIPRVKLSKAVDTIRLPRSVGNLPSYAGAETELAGWGRISDSSDSSIKLMYAKFTVITHETCILLFGTDMIYSGKLCTNARTKSACTGDSGSPLVWVNQKKQAIQIGVFSFFNSLGCENSIANAFTSTDYYLGWINGKTGIDFKP